MRKLVSFLFISLDGVVEEPIKFVGRNAASEDVLKFLGETIAEQDAVLLGRKMYEEWSGFWPKAKLEPFASFINSRQKYVVSSTLNSTHWGPAKILRGPLDQEVAGLKASVGGTIGVHGSVSVVQSLLRAGLIDELRFIQFPVVSGNGRRLLEEASAPIRLHLDHAHKTPNGLQYLTLSPEK